MRFFILHNAKGKEHGERQLKAQIKNGMFLFCLQPQAKRPSSETLLKLSAPQTFYNADRYRIGHT
jgi:hypothetical protein